MPYNKKADILTDKPSDSLSNGSIEENQMNNNFLSIENVTKLNELIHSLTKCRVNEPELTKQFWIGHKNLLVWDQNKTKDELLWTILNLFLKKRIISGIKFLFKPDKFIKSNIEDQQQAYHTVLSSRCSEAIRHLIEYNEEAFLHFLTAKKYNKENKQEEQINRLQSLASSETQEKNKQKFFKMTIEEISQTNPSFLNILKSKTSHRELKKLLDQYENSWVKPLNQLALSENTIKLIELVNLLESEPQKILLTKESWTEYRELLVWDQNEAKNKILCKILNLFFKKRITSEISFLFKTDKFIKGDSEDQKQAFHTVLSSHYSEAIKQLDISDFLKLYVGDVAGTNKACRAILSSKCSDAICHLMEHEKKIFLRFLTAKELNEENKQQEVQIGRLQSLASSYATKKNKQKFFKMTIEEISQTNPSFLNILKSKTSHRELKKLLDQYERASATLLNKPTTKHPRNNTKQNKRKVDSSDETSQSNKKTSASTNVSFASLAIASSFNDSFIEINQCTFPAGNTLMSAMIPDPIIPANDYAPLENPPQETNDSSETISTFWSPTLPFYQIEEEPVCFFNYLPSTYGLIEENYMSDINEPPIKNTNGDAILFSEQETDPTCLLSAALIDEQLASQFPISKSITGQDLITPASIIPDEAGKTSSISLFSSGITLFGSSPVNTPSNSKLSHQDIRLGTNK